MKSNKEMMRKRLISYGGIEQENRMIRDKRNSLQKALFYSYQACTVRKVQPFDTCLQDCQTPAAPTRALINPDKVKQDYDDKILSIPYEDRYTVGDVFEWCKTNTHWIVYLREVTEDAYFRGEIRRCRYIINFKDEEGNIQSTYAAIRGPVETQIDSIQKNQIRIDRPNLSLNILIPRNTVTLKAFDRYKEFLFAGKCWRVEAVDSISMENIIEVAVEEYFINRETDDVENEIKDGLVIKPIEQLSEIAGATLIRPLIEEKYTIDREGGSWSIKEQCVPVALSQGTAAHLTWTKSTAHRDSFTLVWSDGIETVEKVIVVDSLF